MKFSLRISPEAESDLEQAYRWYCDHRVDLGDEFLDAVEVVFDRIVTSPEVHAATYRNIRQTLLRRFPYVVCYILEGQHIEVIAVFHAHRDPTSWQKRVE